MAVTQHLVLPRAQPFAQLGIALQRDGARAEADENRVLIEHSREAPHPDAAAELEMRLGAEVAPNGLDRGRVLAPRVVDTVPVEQVELGALFVVHDHADSDGRPVRPAESRGVRAVPDEVPLRACTTWHRHDSFARFRSLS